MRVEIFFEGEVRFERSTRVLLRGEREVPLSPRLFALLVHLVDARDRVVTKEELLETVWAGDVVVPEVLTTAIRSLRVALGDSSDEPRFVLTVRGAGYRFVAPVRRELPADTRAPSVTRVRHDGFVGREPELECVASALLGSDGARLVHVHGAGGIGKTSLLQEIAIRVRESTVPVAELYAEHVGARPRSFERAVALAFGCPDMGELVKHLSTRSRSVLLVDGLESLQSLGGWFLEALLPRLPDSMRIVIASRSAPPRRWLSDPAWCAMSLEVALAPLDEHASRQLLATRGLVGERAKPVLDFAKGHPLALALGAAVVERGVDPHDVPQSRDVVDTLVDVFAAHTPSADHRRALEVASMLTSIDESLLAHLCPSERETEVYAWLATLAFARKTDRGVQLHELVRESLLQNLRWRNQERLRSLATRCYDVHLELLDRTHDRDERMRLANRIMSLGRHHPSLRPFYGSEDSSHPAARVTTSDRDLDAASRLLARHEGEEAASLLARWITLGLGELWTIDDGAEVPAGFVLVLHLEIERLERLTWDPAIVAIRRYLERHPVGPKRSVVVNRWLVARDDYQTPGVVMQRAHEIVNCGMHSMSLDVSHTFVVYGQPETWRALSEAAHFDIEREGFRSGPRHCAVFARSWVEMPLREWTRALVDRVTSARLGAATSRPTESAASSPE